MKISLNFFQLSVLHYELDEVLLQPCQEGSAGVLHQRDHLLQDLGDKVKHHHILVNLGYKIRQHFVSFQGHFSLWVHFGRYYRQSHLGPSLFRYEECNYDTRQAIIHAHSAGCTEVGVQGSGVVEEKGRLHIAEQVKGDHTRHQTGGARRTLGYIKEQHV